jgi:hypothetical protein
MVRAITEEEMAAKFDYDCAVSAWHKVRPGRGPLAIAEMRIAYERVEMAANKWDAATFRANGEWEQANK